MTESKPGNLPEPRTSFASLLTAFRGVAKEAPWDSSELAEDTSSVSYENGLCKHQPIVNGGAALAAVKQPVRKTSIISIRLTADEEIQLRTRAAEAQLSLSDYLRSCISEPNRYALR